MKKHIVFTILAVLIILGMLFKPESKALPYVAQESDMVEVEITGAVYKPGIYLIHPSMSLAYLIELSGGLEPHADISNIMLNQSISNESYHIPSFTNQRAEIIKRINLNEATYNELINIPHITENRALEILLYKKTHGTFKRIEDLLNVKGIGAATFDKIKIYFYT